MFFAIFLNYAYFTKCKEYRKIKRRQLQVISKFYLPKIKLLGAISISSYIQIEGWMNGYAGRHG
jgi:hypothetical protein